MFFGSIPALVTPFRDGRVAEDTFAEFVEWQIGEGSNGLVPCGTTGEVATLTHDEQHRLFKVAVAQARGRVPVIAGCGSNNTATVIEHLRSAREAGADAALVVIPYYNKPSQAGLIAHFSFLAEHGELPMVLYNVPGRTVTDLLPETVCELAEKYPDVIVAIKDASEDLSRVADHRMGISRDFCQLSGNDELALPFNAAGGKGCISVTANVAPALCAEFQAACAANDLVKARELNDRLYPLHYAMFEDSSPAPVKYALSRTQSWMTHEVRLPLTECSEPARRAVDKALEHAGLV